MAEKGFGVKEVNLIGASGTPTITSPNNLNLNAVNVAISTNATIGGNLTVSGTVGIAGTLTYEDVTNVDAIGIITARTGVKVLAGGINVVGVSYFNNNIVATATTALSVTAADESSDTSCNVLFSTAATGNVAPKTGSNLTFNSSNGTLTATTFSGSGASLTNLPAANLSGTLPAISGANLTGIAVTEAPVTDYTVTANGSSAYRFHGGGVDETADDPDLYLIRGQKYRFNNTTGSSHPFAIRVSNGGSAYTDGVTGSQNGIQFFTVPYSAPASLVYQCTIHGGMVGNIYVRGGSSTVTVSNNGNNRVITGGSGGSLVAEDGFLYNGVDEVSINHVSTSENSYLSIVANANRRKALQFKNGSTINGCIGLGDSDEGVSTSLFLSAKNDPGGASPHMVIDSGGQFCLGTYNSNYGSNDGIVSIVNAASTGTENPLLTLWNPTTVADSRAGIDFLTNAQYGTGRDGAFIRGSNDGVTAKGNLQFGTIKDETYDTNFEIKSTGAVEISSDTGNSLLTLIPTASASTSLIINTWPDNSNGRNWAIRNRYNAHGRLEFMRSTANNNSPLSTTMSLEGANVSIAGALSKGSGSFKIDHPLPSKTNTHHLVHSFVESPQANNLYRGKVDLVGGTATVNIDTVAGMSDGTFVLLNREIQCFTSNETGWVAVKGSVSGNILTITSQENTCTDTISWMVIGERKDKHMYDTDWTDENGKVIVEPLKETDVPL